jgi:galactokinase/mevalonate kinase-like predicted kinase
MAVKIDDLSKEIAKQLNQYTEDVKEAVEEIKEDVSKEAVALLKQTSPKKTGDYRKGWTKKRIGKDFVIHNKTDGQLTHLLENGHAKAGGGRVPAQVHISPVEEKIVESYIDRVEKVVKQ